MINLILFSFFATIFYIGFICGAKYKTFKDFWLVVKKQITSLVS